MPTVKFIGPVDQPSGTGSLMQRLRSVLTSQEFREVRIVSAFAKLGPLLRLSEDFRAFHARGGSTVAVFGIDHRSTTLEAVQFALREFNAVYICHHPDFSVTFHPKLYFALGTRTNLLFMGSSNLTEGGLETNFESMAILEYRIPDEANAWASAEELWRNLLVHPNTKLLDTALLQTVQDFLGRETSPPAATGTATPPGSVRPILQYFPRTPVNPPTPFPAVTRRRTQARQSPQQQPPVQPEPLPSTLVIEIVPHRNGEVFLSKSAVDEYPQFFGFPFTGQTTPKLPDRPPYPQRVPDPVVNLFVYDTQDQIVAELIRYQLNTIFYQRKGEIRITITPPVVRLIPPHSLLLMRRHYTPPPDYTLEVFPPGSPSYQRYLHAANRSMPAGGAGTGRKYGWL